jgi:putative redox protein
MPGELSARVVLQEKVRFLGSGSGDQSIVIDYPPPLGDDSGLRGGLELLLMALAACAGQTVVPLLRRMRQPIETCTVEARGTRRDEHPTLLTDIHLTFGLRGQCLDAATVERAIDLAEQQYCPVWAMLKGGTRITRSVEIVETGEPLVS